MKKLFCLFCGAVMLAVTVGCVEETSSEYSSEIYTEQTTVTSELDLSDLEQDDVFANLTTFSLENLQYDFNTIVSRFENESPKLFTNQETMDAVILEQREKLVDGMNEVEFLRVAAPVVASINCAHSGLNVSSNTYQNIYNTGLFFALDVRIINDEIIVIDNELDSTLNVGSLITSINGVSSLDIIRILKKSLPSDGQNETRKYAYINDNFRRVYYLYIDSTKSHIVKYKDVDSDIILVTQIDAVSSEEINSENFNPDWCPYEAEFFESYAILKIYGFQPYGDYTISRYQSFFDDFFLTIENEGIENIILDLRGNGGGDPMISSYLFSYLAKTEQPYFSSQVPDYYQELKTTVPFNYPHFYGHLFTIMDGNSGSTSGHLLALLKYQDIGVFVGEESGASFAVTDSTLEYNLIYTRLRYRLSQQIWDVAVSGLVYGKGIMPDYKYELSLADYLSEDDDILLYTIELIEGLYA